MAEEIWVDAFGAVGDGVVDDTLALQEALEAGASSGAWVRMRAGKTYKVNPVTGLVLPSGTQLDMTAATVTLGGSNQPATRAYCLRTLPETSQVRVRGGMVVGSRVAHPGLQWGKGLWLDSTEDVLVEETSFLDHYFDGVGVGGNTPCRRVELRGVLCGNNRRNALTITHAQGVRVLGCVLRGTSGQEPETGADLEANLAEMVEDVTFMDCLVEENKRTGVHVHQGKGAPPRSIRVLTCHFTNNGVVQAGQPARYHFIGNATQGLRVEDCTFQGGQRGASIGGGTSRAVVSGCKFEVGDRLALVLAGAESPKVFENDLGGGDLAVIAAGTLQGIYGRALVEGGGLE